MKFYLNEEEKLIVYKDPEKCKELGKKRKRRKN